MKKGSGAGGNGRNHTYAASRADGRDARGRMDHVKSQEEAYRILQELPYFTLSMEEFRRGIAAIREQQ